MPGVNLNSLPWPKAQPLVIVITICEGRLNASMATARRMFWQTAVTPCGANIRNFHRWRRSRGLQISNGDSAEISWPTGGDCGSAMLRRSDSGTDAADHGFADFD